MSTLANIVKAAKLALLLAKLVGVKIKPGPTVPKTPR